MALDVKRGASEKSCKSECRELNKSNQAQREIENASGCEE